jgi:hypothetical protein
MGNENVFELFFFCERRKILSTDGKRDNKNRRKKKFLKWNVKNGGEKSRKTQTKFHSDFYFWLTIKLNFSEKHMESLIVQNDSKTDLSRSSEANSHKSSLLNVLFSMLHLMLLISRRHFTPSNTISNDSWINFSFLYFYTDNRMQNKMHKNFFSIFQTWSLRG